MSILIFIINILLLFFNIILYIIEYVLVRPFLWCVKNLILFKDLRAVKKWRINNKTYDLVTNEFSVNVNENDVLLKIKENEISLNEIEFQALLDYYSELNKNKYDFKKR